MVLWELTLATAYFLGLRRTYRLALKIQRRILPRNPRVREFAHRRTRNVFDVVVAMQKKFQALDISAGKRLGNWLLRRSSNTTTPPSAVPPVSKVIKALPESTSAGKLPPSTFIFTPQPSSLKSIKLPSCFSLAARKKLQDRGRLYSVLSMEKSTLRNSLIREDIAAYAGLPRAPKWGPATC